MTRATLLHVLDRPTALGAAEVRELEQLAQAFPYCQTAHLLLAKAAHDQGTMLASQRLRRAATYAADRTLLRRLIEQVEPASEVVPEVEEPAALTLPAAPEAVAFIAPAEALPAPEALAAMVPAVAPIAETPVVTAEILPPVPTVAPIAAVVAPPAVVPAPVVAVAAPVVVAPPSPAPVVETLPNSPLQEADFAAPATEIHAPTTSLVVEPTPEVPVAISVPDTVALVAAAPPVASAPFIAPAISEPVAVAEVTLPAAELAPAEPVETAPLGTPAVAAVVQVEEAPVLTVTAIQEPPDAAPEQPMMQAPVAAEEPDLPAQAPAIRPPVEVGEARFEFGLAEAAPPVVPTYELPGLVDEWAASAVTRSMGSPLPTADLVLSAPAPVVFTPAAFTGDATVGYSFGESSRLGFSMQLLDLLAAKAEAAETATAVVAAAQPPAGPLPPVGTFFEPDPLLLDHWATHCPPIPVLPSSLDLINNFLKRQPRLTRPAMLPPAPGGQTDLSVRSTRAEPDLVSENLARIFVRQGKIVRAIEIYEKLMVKHPEKMAYFAAQIQSLQPSA